MASTPADRLDTIRKNYEDAQTGEPHDLAAASSASQVTAIQANVGNARSAFFSAEADALNNDGPEIEAAFTAANDALAQVKKARADAAALPTLLTTLTASTTAATTLFKLAKAVGA